MTDKADRLELFVAPGGSDEGPGTMSEPFRTLEQARDRIRAIEGDGKNALPDRTLFWDLWGNQAAIHGPWKIVGDSGNHNGKFDKATACAKAFDYMLVNLENDLGETTDLKAMHPAIYKDLKKQFVNWLSKASDYN